MTRALPLLLVLLAAGLGFWLLAHEADPTGPAMEPGDGGDAPGVQEGELREASGMQGRDRPRARMRPRLPGVDSREVPRGTIVVTPVGPSGQPVSQDHLTVRVIPAGSRDWIRQLGFRDEQAGTWTFRKVLTGAVDIHVLGDHARATRARAVVRADRPTHATVEVEPGGAIRYDVVLPDKNRPAQVTLSLFDAGGEAVEACFRASNMQAGAALRRASSATLGPEGVVLDLPAGTFRLRAESPSGAYDDVEVDVEPGATTAVTIHLGS